MLYVTLVEACMDLTPVAPGGRGSLSTGVRWSLRPRPDSDGKYGRVQAINLETRKSVWMERQRAPQSTGTLATAGGVVFAGALDRSLIAYDDMSGKELWRTRLGDVPSNAPISYAVNGRQYLAVVVGNGGAQAATFPALVPEITESTRPWSSRLRVRAAGAREEVGMRYAPMLAAVLILASAHVAAAQQPDRLLDMQVIASSLGVSCNYCHAQRGDPPAVTAGGKSRQDVAREMIAMTRALNATVQTAAGKPANETVQVGCITCHRGVPIPRQLTDILWTTTVRQGSPAAVAQYRELRGQFYGKQAYDFSEDALILIASRIGQARPEDAIALMDLNLEFFPRSARSYITLSIAQSRRDAPAAIVSLKKALEIDPDNAEAKGRLYQLEQIVERQQRR